MSSLEISSSCFNQETKLPLSLPLVEGSAFEPPGKDMKEVEEKSKDIVKFIPEKLSVDEVSQLVISPLCGGISLFVGNTRNNFEGKKVISLEYEAYLPMAENEIRKICSDIRQKWPVKHIAVFHRLGYDFLYQFKRLSVFVLQLCTNSDSEIFHWHPVLP